MNNGYVISKNDTSTTSISIVNWELQDKSIEQYVRLSKEYKEHIIGAVVSHETLVLSKEQAIKMAEWILSNLTGEVKE